MKKILIKTYPIFKDEENWLNEMIAAGYSLMAITLHALSNEKKFYFSYDEWEVKKS